MGTKLVLDENNQLHIQKYVINFKNHKRIIVHGDSGIGKSVLTKMIEAIGADNAIVFFDTEDYAGIRDRLKREEDSQPKFIIIDTCNLKCDCIHNIEEKEKHLSLLDHILSDSNNYYIIIEQDLGLLLTPIYTLTVSGKFKVLDEKYFIQEFLSKVKPYKYNPNKTTIILCEDFCSGFEFYKVLTEDTTIQVYSYCGNINFQRIYDVVKKIPNCDILLCVDYIHDNPIVMEKLHNVDLTDNTYILNTHSIEEVIVYQLKKFLDNKTYRQKIAVMNKQWLDIKIRECEFILYEDVRNEILSKDFKLSSSFFLEDKAITFERYMTAILGRMIKYNKAQFHEFNFKCFKVTEFNSDGLKLFNQDIIQLGLNKPVENIEYIEKAKLKEEPYRRYQKFLSKKIESLVQFTNRLKYMIPFDISLYSDIILDMWSDRSTLMDIYMTIIEIESEKWETDVTGQTHYYKEV